MSAVTLLAEAIESWEYARQGVIAEAEGLPEEQWSFRPHDGARSFAEIVRHVLESGLMMVGELTDPEGDFTRDVPGGFIVHHAGHLPADAGPSEMKSLLSSTLAEGVAKLQEAGEVAMLQTIRRFDGELWTRLAWLHHGIAHEEYHRGQLAMYARIQGLVPALTRLIHGQAAR